MAKYKVKYNFMLGKHEVGLHVFVNYDGKLRTVSEVDQVIDQANKIMNRNMHIPYEILNDSDVEVHPAP